MSRRQAILGRPSLVSGAGFFMPITSTTGAGAADYYRTIPIPSDIREVSIKAANRLYNAAAGSDIVLPSVAIGTSDGAGGFLTAPTTFANKTVPGDGTIATIVPTTPITRGSDGCITLAFTYPGGGGTDNTAYSTNLLCGNYATAGGGFFPTPSFNGQDTNPLFQMFVGYRSAKRPFLCLGDSILVGATIPATACGYLNAAWIQLIGLKDLAVDIDGMQGGFMSQFADPVTYPYLWDGQDVAGHEVVIQLGVNDTGGGDAAATILANFELVAAHARSLGATRIIAQTILPNINSPYGATANIQRVAYNALLTGGSSSADLVADLCPAVWDPANHNALDAAYDSGDGLHPNTAGNTALANSLITILGL